MEITAQQLSKRFRYEWIIKSLDYTFAEGQAYAILGPNGVGKSTLMKMLSGYLSPTRGKVSFSLHGQPLDRDQLYRQVAYAAPYIDLIESFTLDEAIRFHRRFKAFQAEITPQDIHDLLAFRKSKHKQIRYFSSGMKQRLKLALALASDTALLLLDEPTTNLDTQGVDWYQGLVERFVSQDRTVIVASNVEQDYHFCTDHLSILDYK